MPEEQIEILLAAYNGDKFIAQQIDSIINQTYKNWQLYIRDDGSTDNTPNIIKSYANNSKIHIISDNAGNVGSCANFFLLMKNLHTNCKYIMFSDQDDFWQKDKIEITLKEMLRLEKTYGNAFPLLVHTNFTYVDKNLDPIVSKKDFQATKIVNLQFVHLLAQNPVYGCTMMINKALFNLVGFIPPAAENHDYWIALVATAFGKVAYLNERTILYRQHDKNISGQHNNNLFMKRLKRLLVKDNFKDANRKLIMADCFRKTYAEKLSTSQKKLIDDFINFSVSKSPYLFIRNIKNGIKRQTFLQTILFYISLFLLRPGSNNN